MSKNDEWFEVITPRRHLLDIDFGALWNYRDLLILFVRRDLVATYKQTILGPLWFFIQPVLTTFMFIIIFGELAGVPTDGVPRVLFYMCGIVSWNYFSDCLTKTSNTFVSNSSIFGKVYFPRLILPLSVVVSNVLKFLIQFSLFLLIYFYYIFFTDAPIIPERTLFLFPLLVVLMAGLGLGFGLLISSLTTKYRDVQFLITFGIQLLMYATPIVYPLAFAREKLGRFSWVTDWNPMTPVIETIKVAFLGKGTFEPQGLVYSFLFMFVVLVVGVITFNKVEQTFMDTV